MSNGFMSITELTWDEFVETFDLVPNPEGDDMWDTHEYWDDLVSRSKENKVWTYVECDSGTCIIEGLHFVNRLGYYVTVRPYDENKAYEVDYMEDEVYE